MRSPYWLEVIGAVCWRGTWRTYSATSADWILDYVRYDPTCLNGTWSGFRGGLYQVDVDRAGEFVTALSDYELTRADIESMVAEFGPSACPLCVVVDFDTQRLVNGYSELPIHEYVPAGWTAYEGFPLQYVPEEIAALWRA